MPASMQVLTLTGVGAGYGRTRIIRDVSIDVAKGEVLAVIGRNGVGKTTLMKTVIGLLGAATGTVTFGGEDVTRLDASERARRGIGYVPQGRDVFPRLTVEENLRMGDLVGSRSGRSLGALVYEYFPRLAERRRQTAGTMSGGEQQMLAIGRALVGGPDLLLLDEPSEGIQPSIVRQIGENVRRMNRDLGITVLFVEQNIELILEMAHRCYVMDKGTIVTSLAPQALEDPETVKRYLAV